MRISSCEDSNFLRHGKRNDLFRQKRPTFPANRAAIASSSTVSYDPFFPVS